MALLDNIFKKKSDPSNISKLVDLFTKLSPEDLQDLKDIASGKYLSKESDPKYSSYLDLIDKVYTNGYGYGEEAPRSREQLYNIYDEMDDMISYISAALDILSDDATQADADGTVIKVISDSEKVTNLTQDMIDRLELEERISKWARVVAKYGDFFIKLSYENNKGVTKILDTIYPSKIERYSFDGELVAFGNSESSLKDGVYTPWDFVHFKHVGDIVKNTNKSVNGLYNSRLDATDHDLTSSYGNSILRPAIKVYAQLRFVENMILLSRLTNSIRRNIFLINVGDVAPDKSFETIQNYATLLKKNINLDLESSMYDSQKRTVSYDEDIFIPVSDPKNDVRIEQVGGDVDIGEQYDLEYLLNKLFSAIKIPKAYLNYEQDLNARSTLIQLDIRYARTVSRLQQTLRGGLIRLAKINLAFHGINPEAVDLDIQLTPVSTIDEDSKRQELQSKLSVATDFWNAVVNVNEKLSGGGAPAGGGMFNALNSAPSDKPSDDGLDLKYAAELVFTDYLGLNADEVNKLFKKDADDDKQSIGKTVKIRKRIKSSDPDIHAMYPTTEGKKAFERLRENITKSTVVNS